VVRDIESVDESEVALRCVTVNGKRHPKFMEDTAIVALERKSIGRSTPLDALIRGTLVRMDRSGCFPTPNTQSLL